MYSHKVEGRCHGLNVLKWLYVQLFY